MCSHEFCPSFGRWIESKKWVTSHWATRLLASEMRADPCQKKVKERERERERENEDIIQTKGEKKKKKK
jgi:hypothetical protein